MRRGTSSSSSDAGAGGKGGPGGGVRRASRSTVVTATPRARRPSAGSVGSASGASQASGSPQGARAPTSSSHGPAVAAPKASKARAAGSSTSALIFGGLHFQKVKSSNLSASNKHSGGPESAPLRADRQKTPAGVNPSKSSKTTPNAASAQDRTWSRPPDATSKRRQNAKSSENDNSSRASQASKKPTKPKDSHKNAAKIIAGEVPTKRGAQKEIKKSSVRTELGTPVLSQVPKAEHLTSPENVVSPNPEKVSQPGENEAILGVTDRKDSKDTLITTEETVIEKNDVQLEQQISPAVEAGTSLEQEKEEECISSHIRIPHDLTTDTDSGILLSSTSAPEPVALTSLDAHEDVNTADIDSSKKSENQKREVSESDAEIIRNLHEFEETNVSLKSARSNTLKPDIEAMIVSMFPSSSTSFRKVAEHLHLAKSEASASNETESVVSPATTSSSHLEADFAARTEKADSSINPEGKNSLYECLKQEVFERIVQHLEKEPNDEAKLSDLLVDLVHAAVLVKSNSVEENTSNCDLAIATNGGENDSERTKGVSDSSLEKPNEIEATRDDPNLFESLRAEILEIVLNKLPLNDVETSNPPKSESSAITSESSEQSIHSKSDGFSNSDCITVLINTQINNKGHDFTSQPKLNMPIGAEKCRSGKTSMYDCLKSDILEKIFFHLQEKPQEATIMKKSILKSSDVQCSKIHGSEFSLQNLEQSCKLAASEVEDKTATAKKTSAPTDLRTLSDVDHQLKSNSKDSVGSENEVFHDTLENPEIDLRAYDLRTVNMDKMKEQTLTELLVPENLVLP